MPVNLNLLPPELSVSKSLDALLKTLRAVGVIAVVAFLVFGVGVTAFFMFNKLTLDNVNTKVSSLKTQVAAQEKSEQQLVLLKDRLEKVISVQNLPSSLPSLNTIKPIFTGFSDNTVINQMQVDTTGANLSLNIKINSDLTSFLASIQNPDVFSSVNLTLFDLNPTTGYTAAVQLVKK